MNVSLTTEMEQWVQQKVGSGLYSSASEVVRKSLQALYASETQKVEGRSASRLCAAVCSFDSDGQGARK